MAKARFPGKPPKTSQITRLRVSTKCVSYLNDTSRLAAQETAIGLQYFNENFPSDGQDENDFIGFEKIGDTFKAHFEPRKQQHNEISHFRDPVVERDKCPKRKKLPVSGTQKNTSDPVNNLKHNATASDTNGEPRKCEVQKVKFELKPARSWNNITNNCSVLNGSGNESSIARKLVEKAKSPKKFVLPTKSIHSSRPIIPNKKFLEANNVSKLKNDNGCEEFGRSQQKIPVRRPSFSAKNDDSLPQEKNRMKREIERYTDIMTTDMVDHKCPVEGKIKKRKKSEDKDKEGKLQEKIQQLLRSQWESRLQLVDNKSDVPFERRDCLEDRGSSMSVSSEEDILCFKRSNTNSANNGNNSNNSAMKSKIILRKARLQLNHKMLKQLRQPSRLQEFQQQLVNQGSPTTEPTPKAIQPASILRPAQLVFQSPATTSLQIVVKAPKESTKPVSDSSSHIKSAKFPSQNDTTNKNPLGCAFVTEPSESKGLPGTVVCGVCGAVRRYSFILQARKFGTFSCEPCRKFISRVLRGRTPVICTSGNGDCIRPPVPRWSSDCPVEDRPPGGEVMTSRCKACWLKLALTGFRMRESDHDELRNLLPFSMQKSVPDSAHRPEFLEWAPNRGQVFRTNTKSKSNAPVTAPPPVVEAVAAPVPVSQKHLLPRKAEHCPGSRAKKEGQQRSSLELTGPRVKHVCRSAMLARGQPRAMFHNQEQANNLPLKHCDGESCSCCSSSDSSSAASSSNEVAPK